MMDRRPILVERTYNEEIRDALRKKQDYIPGNDLGTIEYEKVSFDLNKINSGPKRSFTAMHHAFSIDDRVKAKIVDIIMKEEMLDDAIRREVFEMQHELNVGIPEYSPNYHLASRLLNQGIYGEGGNIPLPGRIDKIKENGELPTYVHDMIVDDIPYNLLEQEEMQEDDEIILQTN